MRFIRGSLDKPPVSFVFGNQGWKCLTSASVIPAGFELMPFPMIRNPGVFGNILQPLAGSTLPTFEQDPLLIGRIADTQFADEAEFRFVIKNGAGKVVTLPDPVDPLRRWPEAKGLATTIAEDIDKGVTAARAFHDRLGDYIFPRTGAVILRGVSTVQRIEVGLKGGKLDRVEETRSEDGDGTVPAASQKYLVPDEFVSDTIRFRAHREMDNVEHAEALGEKGRPFFGGIFELMNLLYAAAPLSV
jgi:hypothetical protein